MSKLMSKMTKAELLGLIASKDAELIRLRDELSVKRAEVQFVDRRALMQRAAHLSQTTRCMHRVHGGRIERYVNNAWQAV